MDTNTRELSLDVIVTHIEHMAKQNEDMKESVDGLRQDMKQGFERIDKKMEDKYATKFEVQSAIKLLENDLVPTKNIVYGLVAIITGSFIVAVVSLIMK